MGALPAQIRIAYRAYMLDEKGWSRNTRQTRIDTVEAFAAFCLAQQRSWLTARRETVLAYIGRSQQSRTRNQYLGALRAFYAWAMREEFVRADPTAGIDRVREPRSLPRPLTRQQAKAMLAAARTISPRAGAVVALLLFSGLRRTEALSLMWGDVDLTNGVVRVENGKGGKDRQVPVPPLLVEALCVWRARSVEGAWVFPSEYRPGEHLHANTLWRDVQLAAEAARIEGVTPHRLRHSYATEMLRVSHDVTQVKELLGHASLASTQVYAKVETSELAKVVKRLNYDP